MANKKSTGKKNKFRVAGITSASVIALLLVVTLLATQNTFLYETLNAVFGGPVAHIEGTESAMRYTADYGSKDEVYKAANELSREIENEGIILLKNEDNALPLKKDAKITVFGKNSVNLVLGGSGSSAGSGAAVESDLYAALTASGFTVNPVMKSFVEKTGSGRTKSPTYGDIIYGFGTGEIPVSSYTATERNSYKDYNDAALVVISRIGGEGYDLPRTMRTGADPSSAAVEGARNKDDHYLQLDQYETDMIKEACENFDTVIIVLNSAATMELGFLDDASHYAYHPNIKGCVNLGLPGGVGVQALGEVLNGNVTPSGHNIDTYPRNLKEDPTWANFGNQNVAEGNSYLVGGQKQDYYYVDYEEGIYVGYRYYETRGFTDGEEWYHDHVVYPFGYGLSYTTFSWEAVDKDSAADGAKISSVNDTFSYKVKVKNTGSQYSGKDVVQVYVTAPYTAGGIEKSHVILAGFAKTKLLAPGEEDIVEVKLAATDLLSYDYNDANDNGFKGYELESGDYIVRFMTDAHTAKEGMADKKLTVAEGITVDKDWSTGTEITNLFDDISDRITTYLSRNDWEGTMPTTPTEADRTVTADWIGTLNYKFKVGSDTENDPWYSAEEHTQPAEELTEVAIRYPAMVGVDYNDEKWDAFLDQLTLKQMRNLISTGNYQTSAVENVGKPQTTDADGPQGFALFMGNPAVYQTAKYPGENVIAATWSVELAENMGRMIGNEGLIGNEKGDGIPYTGWYAPACNIHRSQFGGRDWEYYSEDGYISGKMAAATIRGAQEKGIVPYVKHFVMNDQETNRDSNGVFTWGNEQAMREIYFKPFETSVKEGGSLGLMSSFNRMGTHWTGGYYNLLTRLLRDEWGFKGVIITDYGNSSYMTSNEMIRGGGDLYLGQGNSPVSSKDTSATSVSVIRKAAKNIFYAYANSNAMNGITENSKITYTAPVWVLVTLAVDAAIVALLAVWMILAYRKTVRKK